MIKLQIGYQSESEKSKIIEVISKDLTIKNISKPYKQGKYYRVYVDVE
ncbi:MAG: hypothetical protein ACLS28_24060 [Clostridium neonatale]